MSIATAQRRTITTTKPPQDAITPRWWVVNCSSTPWMGTAAANMVPNQYISYCWCQSKIQDTGNYKDKVDSTAKIMLITNTK